MATVATINSSYASQDYAESMRDDAIAAAVASANGYTNGQISSLSSVYATPSSVTTTVSSAITASLASTSGGTIGGAIAALSSVYATPASVTSTVSSAISASLASTTSGTIGAAILSEQTTRANNDTALGTRIDNTEAAIGKKISRQPSAPSSPAVGDYWVDSDDGNKPYVWSGSAWVSARDAEFISTVSTVATISSNYSTQAYADGRAVVRRDEAITAATASANSYTNGQISSLASVYATPASVTSTVNSAISASLSSTAGGTIGGAIAALSSVYATPSYVTSTVSSSVSAALTTAASDAQARVNTEASARAAADGNLSGKYTIRVDSGTGAVAGMNITSASGPGSNTSEISFLANVFKIQTSGGAVTPFTVSGSTVRVTGSLIIEQSDVNGLPVTLAGKVSAGGAAADINANSTTISGGKITTGTLDADRISGGTITASISMTAAKISTSKLAGNVQIFHPADETRLFPTTSHAQGVPFYAGNESPILYINETVNESPSHGGLGRIVTSNDWILEGWLRGSTGFDSKRFGSSSLKADVSISGWGFWQNSGRADIACSACYRVRDSGGAWGSWTVLSFWDYVPNAPVSSGGFNLSAPLNGVTLSGTQSLQFGVYFEMIGSGHPPYQEYGCINGDYDEWGNFVCYEEGWYTVPASGPAFRWHYLIGSIRVFNF
jgi:hypothetical protein